MGGDANAKTDLALAIGEQDFAQQSLNLPLELTKSRRKQNWKQKSQHVRANDKKATQMQQQWPVLNARPGNQIGGRCARDRRVCVVHPIKTRKERTPHDRSF